MLNAKRLMTIGIQILKIMKINLPRELGCSLDLISSITGHETAQMAEKYSKQERSSELAIERLNQATN